MRTRTIFLFLIIIIIGIMRAGVVSGANTTTSLQTITTSADYYATISYLTSASVYFTTTTTTVYTTTTTSVFVLNSSTYTFTSTYTVTEFTSYYTYSTHNNQLIVTGWITSTFLNTLIILYDDNVNVNAPAAAALNGNFTFFVVSEVNSSTSITSATSIQTITSSTVSNYVTTTITKYITNITSQTSVFVTITFQAVSQSATSYYLFFTVTDSLIVSTSTTYTATATVRFVASPDSATTSTRSTSEIAIISTLIETTRVTSSTSTQVTEYITSVTHLTRTYTTYIIPIIIPNTYEVSGSIYAVYSNATVQIISFINAVPTAAIIYYGGAQVGYYTILTNNVAVTVPPSWNTYSFIYNEKTTLVTNYYGTQDMLISVSLSRYIVAIDFVNAVITNSTVLLYITAHMGTTYTLNITINASNESNAILITNAMFVNESGNYFTSLVLPSSYSSITITVTMGYSTYFVITTGTQTVTITTVAKTFVFTPKTTNRFGPFTTSTSGLASNVNYLGSLLSALIIIAGIGVGFVLEVSTALALNAVIFLVLGFTGLIPGTIAMSIAAAAAVFAIVARFFENN